MMGAAWATVASYAVMATLGAAVSRRLYAIPFEASRMSAIALLAGLAFACGRWAPASLWTAIAWKAVPLAAFAGGAYAIASRPRRDEQEA